MIYIYTRVSTQGQADKGDSIEGQIKKCKGWIMMEDLDDEVQIIEEKAVSGGVPLNERPQGKLFYDNLQEGDFLICYKLDRLFRDSLDALQVTKDLTARGIGLVLLNIHHKDITRDAVGKLVLTILSAVAEMEKETIRERMKDGKAIKKEKGFWLGGHVPFGYKADKTDAGTKLIEDPETMPALKFIMGNKDSMSLRKISEELKGAGYNLSFVSIGRIIRKHEAQDGKS